ncbi:MAG: hypothetical protein ABR538_12695 [Candidatus Binatia bacterium]
MKRLGSAALCLPVILTATVAAGATIVPGSANPNLAGRADGYLCCGGDAAPQHRPPIVGDVAFSSCDALSFSASGRVSFAPGTPVGNNPDGDGIFDMTNFGDGISAPQQVRVNSLYGVFLGQQSPTGAATPARLNFQSAFGFSSLSPGIGQIFFIGDGLTSDTGAGQFDGAPQSFVAPPGATRLFLGTSDGGGWYNNSGSFTVDTIITPNEHPCGDAAAPDGVTAGDALHVLRSAVGTTECLPCICDADGSGNIAAGDALAVLRRGVGHDVAMLCPCCEPPSTTTTTTTTTTTMPACIAWLQPCTPDGTLCCLGVPCLSAGPSGHVCFLPGLKN